MSAKGAKASPSTMAKEVTSLQVSLPQMLDLALGTPEVGAVNLNILHNFLHILLQQIDLKSTKVEYRGDEANRIKTMVNSLKPGPSLYFQQYNIINGSKNAKQPVRVSESATVKVDVITGEEAELKKTKGSKQQIESGIEGEPETVVYVEPIVNGVIPTALGFKRLEHSVEELQKRFHALEELTTNPELIQRIKGKMTDPLTDVWNIINITKRLDASEQGIDKLTSMVQDVFKGDKVIADTPESSQLEERLTNLEAVLDNMENVVKNLQVIANVSGEEVEPTGEEKEQPVQQRVSLSHLLGGLDIKGMHDDVTTLQKDVSTMREDIKSLQDKVTETLRASPSTLHSTAQSESKKQKDEVTEETPSKVETVPEEITEPKRPEKPLKVQIQRDSVDVEEIVHTDDMKYIHQRVVKLEKDVLCLKEKMDNTPMAGVTGNAELDELVSKIQSVQTDMEKLNQTADRLIDDRENREVHLNALLEQIELLKTIKADREDLEDALAEKADAQAIHRKVSHDQFDAACDDFAQGLEDAINKLGKQESIWQQALDEVQREIEGKVDKIEMTPLKDFVSHRLKALQDKLKGVAQMRQDAEAAGTKKLLRDVQCISCDKNVVMKVQDTNKLKMEPLPCNTSMKPYLTYELDQVRKQHRRLPHSRNMIQFEAAMQEEAKKQKTARQETFVKTPRDHLCNRYCGGSHTVTTPQQRVTRMGHFINQWGPEVVQLTEGMVKGTDGKMYRGRPVPRR
ncbi:PREDICTED: uncharacterized protein LOC107192080 [Dufourea novaeangliae]|uniref:uncharacterized protein LOC107192080 n=1 Tax=Dufourea novaeangliae TaxID=178035 RepID=UPI000767978A|nr:PREDICTED: uncharacterized protein LOC107192080 [Dufourea novaeangliae]